MKIIVVASQKGGVGKTTLTGHLGVQASTSGHGPVALLDTDPQGSLADWWNMREAPEPIFVTAKINASSHSTKALFTPFRFFQNVQFTFSVIYKSKMIPNFPNFARFIIFKNQTINPNTFGSLDKAHVFTVL